MEEVEESVKIDQRDNTLTGVQLKENRNGGHVLRRLVPQVVTYFCASATYPSSIKGLKDCNSLKKHLAKGHGMGKIFDEIICNVCSHTFSQKDCKIPLPTITSSPPTLVSHMPMTATCSSGALRKAETLDSLK